MPFKIPPTCPYCDVEAQLVGGEVIYPLRHDLVKKKFWRCSRHPLCDAYVGVHENSPTHQPLGTLADACLRRARIRLHALLDPLWKGGSMKRRQSYHLLASLMNIPKQDAHVSQFDLAQCYFALQVLSEHLKKGLHAN